MKAETISYGQRQSYSHASEYYDFKLQNAPHNSRYHQLQAALKEAQGDRREAGWHFKEALMGKPHDVMLRSDYAVHLARDANFEDSEAELNRALLLQPEQPTLHKNLAAVLCRRGAYTQALEHALRAVQLNPFDAMNHRNLAKIKEILGDSRAALYHNNKAIELERSSARPNTEAFRAAAVQIITRGDGNHKDAHRLMDAARAVEGKRFQLPTTNRTYEIIAMINKRKGTMEEQMAKEAAAKAAKDAEAAQLKSGVMPSMLDNFKRDKVQESEDD